MNKTLCLALLFLLVPSLATAAPKPAFSERWKPKAAPAFVNGPKALAGTGAPVTVTVRADRPMGRVNPYLLGTNAAVWQGDLVLAQKTVDQLRRGGITMLRFPGGSTSDEYCWDGDYTSFKKAYPNDGARPWNQNGPEGVSTDEFIALCRKVGAEPMITVNFGLARYGSPEEAISLAARWVKYCNVDHRYGVKYWEVGNENYGPWERGTVFPPGSGNKLTGDQYGELFNRFVKAMKAVDPTIRIGAVGLGVDDMDPWSGYSGWMRKMLPVVQDTADFLIVHNYFTWFRRADEEVKPDVLIGRVSQIGEWRANLDAMLRTYTHRKPESLPYAMTEFNCQDPPHHDTIEMSNGLFMMLALGELARSGYANSDVWAAYVAWHVDTLGDHAILARLQPGVEDGTPRPSYFAYALWKRFGDTLSECTTDGPVRAYAGTYAKGGTSVLLVNPTTEGHTVRLDAGKAARASKANLWRLDADGYTSSVVRWNGKPGRAPAGGPWNADTVPPYVLNIPKTGPITFYLPPFSASLLVLRPSR